jgi:hypothetical protein
MKNPSSLPGIHFTPEQEAQIKKIVAAGKKREAQEVIWQITREWEEEFGEMTPEEREERYGIHPPGRP